MIDTNLAGLVRVTHAIATMLARRAEHIVNVGSVSGREPVLGDSLYCASKYGVHGFTEVLRADYADTPFELLRFCRAWSGQTSRQRGFPMLKQASSTTRTTVFV